MILSVFARKSQERRLDNLKPHFHLHRNSHRGASRQQNQRGNLFTKGKDGSLSIFTNIPVDILYEIFLYLHPQDILNLSRATQRLRQLLMTRDARPVWRSALANVEGMPFCPSDLSEPQFASLAFDEHCHLCFAPRVKDVLWSCRIRCCRKCLPKCFLTKGQLTSLIQEDLGISTPEQVFPFVIYPKASLRRPGTTLFYKPAAELYLKQLAALDSSDSNALSRWSSNKRAILIELMAHATLCEHWTIQWNWTHNSSRQFYDFGFTLFLLGLLVFLWKDKLFY